MILIETVGDFIRENYGLTAHCNACRHAADLDLGSVAELLGLSSSLIGRGRPKLRCTACGSVDCSKIVVAPTPWSIGGIRRRSWGQ